MNNSQLLQQKLKKNTPQELNLLHAYYGTQDLNSLAEKILAQYIRSSMDPSLLDALKHRPIAERIIKDLSYKDMIKLCNTNKEFKKVCDDQLWQIWREVTSTKEQLEAFIASVHTCKYTVPEDLKQKAVKELVQKYNILLPEFKDENTHVVLNDNNTVKNVSQFVNTENVDRFISDLANAKAIKYYVYYDSSIITLLQESPGETVYTHVYLEEESTDPEQFNILNDLIKVLYFFPNITSIRIASRFSSEESYDDLQDLPPCITTADLPSIFENCPESALKYIENLSISTYMYPLPPKLAFLTLDQYFGELSLDEPIADDIPLTDFEDFLKTCPTNLHITFVGLTPETQEKVENIIDEKFVDKHFRIEIVDEMDNFF